MEYRLMSMDDYDQVYQIWLDCKNGLNDKDDSREGIEKYLKRNPTTSFVAVEDGRVAGVILCGHDGRRGFIQHMSVAEAYRGRGVARTLVDLALEALRKEDINKVALVAFDHNKGGNAFWESIGFTERTDLIYRNKALVELKIIKK
ncbi:MAG: GNAT family N-acetyltransferase [Clostridiales bacterium]|nr:GNAT family N-acetyltransferase [Clostridiales bacterium]